MPKTVTVNVGDTLDINIDPTTSPIIIGLQTQLDNVYTKPAINALFQGVDNDISDINGVLGVLGTDVTNLKAHPILNSPTNEPILVEISDNTKLNVNHNLMFDGSGSPTTSCIDPADTDGRSYVPLAYFNANTGTATQTALTNIINGTTTQLDGKVNALGTAINLDPDGFNSFSGKIYSTGISKPSASSPSYYDWNYLKAMENNIATKQNLLTTSNAGQFINIDVTVPTIPVISVKESQLSNQIIGIDTYAYSTGTTTTFNAIQTANTNIAKGFYWLPVALTGVNTRTATVASGTLLPGRYLIGYNLNQAYGSSVGIVYKEFQYNNGGMLLDQLVTFTLLVVGNVTNLQTSGITFTITSNTGTLGFITSLDRKVSLTV